MSTTHQIEICREQGYSADRWRSYGVFVDGDCVLRIREGEKKQIAVTPGVHSLTVGVDWCHSQAFTINAQDGQSTALWCWPNVRVYSWPYFLTLGRGRYISVGSQPRAARASSKTVFKAYQFGLVAAVLAFFGYESILGKVLAMVVLVLLLVPAIGWLLLRRARSS